MSYIPIEVRSHLQTGPGVCLCGHMPVERDQHEWGRLTEEQSQAVDRPSQHQRPRHQQQGLPQVSASGRSGASVWSQ